VEQIETELQVLCGGTARKFGRMVNHFKPTMNRRGILANPEVQYVYDLRLHCGKPCPLVIMESDEDLNTFLQRCRDSDTFIPAIAPLPKEETEDKKELPYELRKRIFNILKRWLRHRRHVRQHQHKDKAHQRMVMRSERRSQHSVLRGQYPHTYLVRT
jgi:hypothetical protein